MIADVRAAQVFIERLHGLFSADVAENAVRFERIAAARRSSQQLQLHEIAIFNSAPFHGSQSRRALAHLFERFRHVRFGNVHDRHFDFQALVVPQLEFRQHFENSAELQRLAFGEIQLFNLRLRDRSQLLLRHSLFHAFGHELLQHLAFDVVGKSPPNQRHGGFAGAEARHARNPGKIFGDALDGLGHFFRGNLQVEFAAASRFSHSKIHSFVHPSRGIALRAFAGLYGSLLCVAPANRSSEEAREVRLTLSFTKSV